jgi:membrane-bound lytic murein transglycosylase D
MVIGNLSITRVVLNKYRPVGIIQVEIEETIGHYAEWLGVRASEIRHLNAIPYGQVIHIGQQLKIPLRRTTKEAFEEQRFEYHKELVEDFFSTYRVEAVQIYCIKKGDTLWTLANEEFELPLWLIRRYNPDTDLATLIPSRNLRIPVVEKAI